MRLQSVVILAFVSAACLTQALPANIELANMWLHHQMEPFELTHHFGVGSASQVQPEMYQVIKISSDSADKSRR